MPAVHRFAWAARGGAICLGIARGLSYLHSMEVRHLWRAAPSSKSYCVSLAPGHVPTSQDMVALGLLFV